MTNRSHESRIEEFLQKALAGGALGVPEVEVRARSAGLLGEDQRITHSKLFKRAKKSLCIESVRNGFGGKNAPFSSGSRGKGENACQFGSIASFAELSVVKLPREENESALGRPHRVWGSVRGLGP